MDPERKLADPEREGADPDMKVRYERSGTRE